MVILRTSLVVQWLRLWASKQGICVQSLAGKLRSHMPHAAAKKFFKKRKRQIITPFIVARKTPSLTQICMSSKYSSPPVFVIPCYLPKSNMVWLYLWSATLFTGFCNPSHTMLPRLKSKSKSTIASSPNNFLLLWFHYFFLHCALPYLVLHRLSYIFFSSSFLNIPCVLRLQEDTWYSLLLLCFFYKM